MKGISIRDCDERNVLAFDLCDILRIIGRKSIRSVWRISSVEALGEHAADELHLKSESTAFVDGSQLVELSESVWQVVDGTFEAHFKTDDPPWLIIRAVDSSAYDVETDDEEILQLLRSKFKAVTELT